MNALSARRRDIWAAAGATIVGAAAMVSTTAPAMASPATTTCSVSDYDAGRCLPYLQAEGASPLTSAVRAAIEAGHSLAVDRYERNLPANTTESVRDQIAAGRRSAGDRNGRGLIQPFGGNDGATTKQVWTVSQSYPVGTCTSDDGCQQSDTLNVSFDLNLYYNNVATMYGDMRTSGRSSFGIKSFTCQVKKDDSWWPDPVRGSFSGCVSAPQATFLDIHESSVSHDHFNEQNWCDIKFEFYDARTGLSGGNVEYKSPNWTKDSSGYQYFS
ncbi:hypothetical protein GCM10011489_29190 [Gordonia jinhuaensis]|uniref:Uncharacterized protein n=1 Tax=Gordonia jinhuaensis TaxID=1517702 RepID=A0A916TC11_9ACTN|nr:hypothetical protein GCM10011489_29190 [Gordonia jinhuaensis]